MKHEIRKEKQQTELFLLGLGSAFATCAILFFLLHLSPREILLYLVEFEQHHFYLLSISSLIIAIMLLMSYYQQEKSITSIPQRVEFSSHYSRGRRKLRGALVYLRRIVESYNREGSSVYLDKFKIPEISFKREEVLLDYDARSARVLDLHRALLLGNLYKQKVHLYFKNEEVVYYTVATVWYVDEENISIKGGAIIPVCNIVKVEV